MLQRIKNGWKIQKIILFHSKKFFSSKRFVCNENSKPQQLKDPEITSDFLALAQ